MGTGKVLLAGVAVLVLGGPLEAASGGRTVRAAVRLQSAVAARVTDPALRTRLGDEVGALVSDLRAARRADPGARRAAWTAALQRTKLLEAMVATTSEERPRVRLLHAVAALEHALERATRREDRRAQSVPR